MRRRRLILAGVSTLTMSAALACNAIVGTQDRFLDDGDADLALDGGSTSDGANLDPLLDATTSQVDGGDNVPDPPDGSDGGPLPTETVIVLGPWTTPNGAVLEQQDGGGVAITSYSSATHPVAFPTTQPTPIRNDYTVEAVIDATDSGEFGILGRIQGSGTVVMLSSEYGAAPYPWIGTMGPNTWDPAKAAQGAPYTFAAGRYHFKLNFSGTTAAGKLWIEPNAEPATYQTSTTIAWNTGGGVGFYSYGAVPGLVLQSMKITVP